MDVTTSGAPPVGVRVAVASDLRLMAEAVSAALADAGVEVTGVAWLRPGDPPPSPAPPEPPEVLVLVCATTGGAAINHAQAVIAAYDGPTLVVAGGRPGPAWGALFEAGADVVLPPTAPIRELVDAVGSLAQGEELTSVVERQSLVRQWSAARADLEALRAQLATLSPREREVLEHLHRGNGVAVISAELGVSPTSVRNQIRGLLAKLHVRSQLAAVAVLDTVLLGDPTDPPPPPPPPPPPA